MVQLGRRNAELVSIGWTPPNGNNLAVVLLVFAGIMKLFLRVFATRPCCTTNCMFISISCTLVVILLVIRYVFRYLFEWFIFNRITSKLLYIYTSFNSTFPSLGGIKSAFLFSKNLYFYLQHYFSYLCILSSLAIEASYTFCPVEAYEYSTTLTIYHRLYNLNGLTGLAGFTI